MIFKKKIINNLNDIYYQNVSNIWSTRAYEKYVNAQWKWSDLPFADSITDKNYLAKEYLNLPLTKKIKNKSILEIGSAMGGAYKFLKATKLFDSSQYTGLEVSKMGYEYCVKNYPEVKWLHQDFTKIKKLQKYDYIFERNAIHHMPDPLNAYKKIFKSTNISFSTCFRSCLKSETISDLELANFKTKNGVYFCSIINLFDLIELAIKEGFGNFKITFGGLHERISNNPSDPFYLSPKIDQDKIYLSRCKIRMIKMKYEKSPVITFVSNPYKLIKNLKAVALIYLKLRKIKKAHTK
jgi:SAM-dependent methyltransferase